MLKGSGTKDHFGVGSITYTIAVVRSTQTSETFQNLGVFSELSAELSFQVSTGQLLCVKCSDLHWCFRAAVK